MPRTGGDIGPPPLDLKRPLKEGDLYELSGGGLSTAGNRHYVRGDWFLLLRRTEEAPFGFKARTGNWVVRDRYGVSIWSSMEHLVATGSLVRVTHEPVPRDRFERIE